MRIDRTSGASGFPLGAVFGCVGLGAAAVAAVWLRLGLPQPVCHFRNWTGMPCPTCGSTRMVEALLRGEVVAALAWNPFVFLVLAGVAVWASVTTTRHLLGFPNLRIVVECGERRWLRAAAWISIAGGWAYLVWRGI